MSGGCRKAAWIVATCTIMGAAPAGARPAQPPLWREIRQPSGQPLPLAALVAKSRPAVVQVRGHLTGRAARSSGGRLSVGTGFVISADGFVITNEHVVREAEDLQVRLVDGREVSACVVGQDATTDIALLKLRTNSNLATLPLGDPGAVLAGEAVFVIGSPFGFDHSVSAGILSAKDRIVERTGERAADPANAPSTPYAFYLQTDAAINMGNSGGPMLSRHGLVIGVASAYWGGSQPAQGIGFAIPIDVVKRLLPQLAANGKVRRSWLGVEVQAVDPVLAEAFKLSNTRGALLAAVTPEGPAARAGLHPGDLILGWDEHHVAGVEDFKIYAQLTPPGQSIRVKLWRQGKLVNVNLKTTAATGESVAPHVLACQAQSAGAPLALGLEFVAAKHNELVVRKVASGAAREAGLLPGDVILQVAATAVANEGGLRALLAARLGPHPLLIRRDQSAFWVALPPHLP